MKKHVANRYPKTFICLLFILSCSLQIYLQFVSPLGTQSEKILHSIKSLYRGVAAIAFNILPCHVLPSAKKVPLCAKHMCKTLFSHTIMHDSAVRCALRRHEACAATLIPFHSCTPQSDSGLHRLHWLRSQYHQGVSTAGRAR